MRNNNKHILADLAGQTMIYGLGSMGAKFLNYIVLTPYFTRLFSEQYRPEYGKVTELYAFVVFLMVILTYGMETTLFRYSNTEKNKQNIFSTILTSIISTSIVFLAVVFLKVGSISHILQYPGETYFIKLLAGIVAVEAISAIPFAKLRIENKAKKFATLKIVQVVINIVIMMSIYNILPRIINSNQYLLNEDGIISAKFIFISNLIASSVVLLLLIPEFRDYSIKKVNLKLYKVLLVYSIPLMAAGLGGVVNESLDKVIFKIILGNSEKTLVQLGIYGANYKLASVLLMFIQMFRYAAEPFFFNYEKEKDAKFRYAQVMHVFIAFMIGLALVVLIYLDIFKYFIDKSYHNGLNIVPLIILAYLFYGILFNLNVWYKLTNKTFYAIIITAIGAFVTIFINIKYIPEYNYYACAIAHVCSCLVMVVVSYMLGRKYYRIPYNLKKIFSYIVIGILIYLLNYYVQLSNIILTYILKTISLLIFIIFVAYKENILKIIYSRLNEDKNRK